MRGILPPGRCARILTFGLERFQGARSIERSTTDSNYLEIQQVGANQTAYPDVSLPSDTTYWYRVRAFDAGGNSAYTNSASARTDSLPANDPPADDPPANDPPADDPPANDPPADDPPANDPPADDPPANDPPADDPPANDPPADDPPANDPPADDPPANDPPADDPPANEPPSGPGVILSELIQILISMVK